MITDERVMLTASAAERAYGLRHGAARRLWVEGRIRGQERPGRGRTGRTLWVRVDDLDEVVGGGAKKCPA